MLQRIQTLYLLVCLVLVGLMYKLPFAELILPGERFVFRFNRISLVGDQEISQLNALAVAILLVVITLLLVLTIALYKKRMLQIRFSVVNIILMLGLVGLIYYYSHVVANTNNAEVVYKIATVFPFVTAILNFLALRAIAKDEALVRSMDRIR